MTTTILGLKMQTGVEYGPLLQKVLSTYACAIKSRIGLHDVNNISTTSYGIMLLEIVDDDVVKFIQNDILDIEGIEMQTMCFN